MFPLELACFGFSRNVTPQAFRFQIQHDEVAIPQQTGDHQRKLHFLDISGIHDAIKTEVSPGCGDCASSQCVVEDFTLRTG